MATRSSFVLTVALLVAALATAVPASNLFEDVDAFLKDLDANVTRGFSQVNAYMVGLQGQITTENVALRDQLLKAINTPSITDCSDLKRQAPGSASGKYLIRPDRSQPAFLVYCDMSEHNIGFTKVLQIHTAYAPTRSAFGNVAKASGFTETAKLSDSAINAIAARKQQLNNQIIYRLTSTDTTDKIYIRTTKDFNDLSTAWNVFSGVRSQCMSVSLASCSFASANYYTLDTLHDGTGSGQARRFFTEYQEDVRCFNGSVDRSLRCVNRGIVCDHCMHQNVELWIGYV